MAGKTVGFTLNIQTSDTAKRLGDVQIELERIRKELLAAKKAGDAAGFADLAEQQARLRGEARELNKELRNQNKIFQAAKFPKDSLEGLRQEYADLSRQIARLSKTQRESDFGQNLIKQARGIKNEIDRVGESIGDFRSQVGRYRNSVIEALDATGLVGGNVRALFAGGGLIAAVGAAVGIAADGARKLFELNKEIADLQADVAKTTQLTIADVRLLTEELKALDTRTPIEELLQISTVAGRLGIQGREGVFQFTKAVDTLTVALGDDLGGNAETVTDTVGKLSNVLFGATNDGEQLAQNLLFLGNSLNVLSAEGAASAGTIADFAGRIGAIARPLGVSQGAILGISATLDELGVKAERGGTAVGRIFQALTQDTEKFAEQLEITPEVLRNAGFEANSFADLVNTDLTGALQFAATRVLELSENNTDLASRLKEVGLTGQGELEVFLKLGQANERLSQNINTANNALQNQTSLTDEARVKNENLAGAYQRLLNDIREFFISSGAQDFFVFLIEQTRESFNRFKELLGVFKPLQDAFAELAKALGLVNENGERTEKTQKALNLVWQATLLPLRLLVGAATKLTQAYTFVVQKTQDLLRFVGILKREQEGTARATQETVNELLGYVSAQDQANQQIGKYVSLSSKGTQSTKEFTDQIDDLNSKTETLAKTSLAFLNKQLSDLNTQLSKAPDAASYDKITTQIKAVEDQIAVTQARFDRFRDAARSISNITQALPTLTDPNQSPEQRVQAVVAALDLENTARLENEKEFQELKAEVTKEGLQRIEQLRKSSFERQLAEERAFAEAQIEIVNDLASGVEKTFSDFFESQQEVFSKFFKIQGRDLKDYLELSEESFKDFTKSLVLTILDATEKTIQLQLAQAFGISLASADSVATFGASGLAKFAVIRGLIKGFFAGVKGFVQSFDGGGRINSGIPFNGKGRDSVLISAYPGEVILNTEQQKRLNYLMPGALSQIGVPGFQDGGQVPLLRSTPQLINPNSLAGQTSVGLSDDALTKQAALIAQFVAAAIRDSSGNIGEAVKEGVLEAGQISDRRKQLMNDRTL